MRTHPLRLLVVASLVAGVLAGAVVAVAVPRHATAPTTPRLDPKRTAAALPLPPGQLGLHVLRGSVRTVATAPDPAGGPDWALRRLSGTYVLPAGVPRNHIGKEMFGRKDCVDLGRVVNGRFGWLDGAGTFRAATGGAAASPRQCRAHGATTQSGQEAALTTWVSHPGFGEPRPLATIVWGAAPAGPDKIAVHAADGSHDVHRSADGAFLAFLPAAGRTPAGLHVTATGADGATDELYRTVAFRPHSVPKTGPGWLMARGADPAGGASWGVAASRGPNGTWCSTNPGRVVDGTVGQLDARLDVFYDQSDFSYNCGIQNARVKAKDRVLSRSLPLLYVSTSGAVPGQERPGGSAGRIALRAEPGATIFGGLARADVATITVISPSQTRVIRPTGPAHAFVVALGGSFPTGKVQLVVRFTDGHSVVLGERVDDL
jgi:hypothetical protein